MANNLNNLHNLQTIALLIILSMLGFTAGWMAYYVSAPITAHDFIESCDNLIGSGEWKVQNNTCVPISYINIQEDGFNITLPTRNRFVPIPTIGGAHGISTKQ